MRQRCLLLAIVSVLLIFASCNMSSSQRYASSDLPPSEPGKCYAKCLLPAISAMDTLAYLPIYTGDKPETVEMAEFVIQEAVMTTKWVKVKMDNCQSRKKDDCLVWCLKEIPSGKIAVNYVADTLKTKKYEIQAIVHPQLNEEGKTGWKEVLCDKDIRSDTYRVIAGGLLDNGYMTNAQLLKVNDRVTKKLKAALVNFQKDNNLPVGQMDFETLEALGYKD